MGPLNAGAASDVQVNTLYLRHMVCRGMFSEPASKVFEGGLAIAEMKRYKLIAERMDYLGGNPATNMHASSSARP